MSNEDDIVGQILLAKSKITYESLHHASFTFEGTRVHETTGDMPTKIYRGQQLVVFGRYDKPGQASVTLNARMTGEDKTYRTTFELPDVATNRVIKVVETRTRTVRQDAGRVPATAD